MTKAKANNIEASCAVMNDLMSGYDALNKVNQANLRDMLRIFLARAVPGPWTLRSIPYQMSVDAEARALWKAFVHETRHLNDIDYQHQLALLRSERTGEPLKNMGRR